MNLPSIKDKNIIDAYETALSFELGEINDFNIHVLIDILSRNT